MRLTQIMCPKCKASLSSKAGIEEGTAIACPKCKQKFAASAPDQKVDDEVEDDFEVVDEDEEDTAPAKKPVARRRAVQDHDEEEAPPKKSMRETNRGDDDDDDDEPKSKKRRPADDDRQTTTKNRARDDDDEADDRPRRKKKGKRRKDDEELGIYGKLKANIWLRVSVLGVLLAVFGVTAYLFYQKHNKTVNELPPVVNNDKEPPKPVKVDPPAPNDSQKFQGSWSATAVTWDGQKYSPQGLRDFRFVIRDAHWTAQSDPRNVSRSKIDPAKTPAEIDLLHGPSIPNSVGIYRFVDKDTLEMCSRLEAGDRPKEFTAPEGSKCLHMVLKREATSSEPKKFANDAERFIGSWAPISFNINTVHGPAQAAEGALLALINITKPPNDSRKVRITVKDDQLIVEAAGEIDHYTINIAKTPAEIDFIHTSGAKSLAICKFPDDNTLELCFSLKGERPQTFTPVEGTDCSYILFKRVP